MRFSIIIPNWNGKKLLEKNLPLVLSSGADEVIIVDNGSTDDSLQFLKSFKGRRLKIIENKKNKGFTRAVNQGVITARSEIVILLNNDVR